MLNMSGKCINIKLMDMGNFILIMEIFYKDNLKMVDVKEKEDGSNMMVVIMKVILKIMSQMDMVYILMLMVINIKVNGKIIYPMGKDRPSIQMAVDIMDNS